jgi:ketosteroid isomerase-like protein
MRAPMTVILLTLLTTLTACDQARKESDDVAAIEAIDDAVGELDEAFESQDAATIKGLMTSDHIAVTHYYPAPLSVDEQIASLPDLKYDQTTLTQPTVTQLSPDIAMRTLTAKLDGSYKGNPISGEVFITSIMTKQGGKWLEQFYQVTSLEP